MTSSRVHSVRPNVKRWAVAAAVVAFAGTALPVDDVSARSGADPCERRNNNRYEKLLECVDADGVFDHLEAFQAIADANGGTRADQTPGYEASVQYVLDTVRAAGWTANAVEFGYPGIDATIDQILPTPAMHTASPVTGTDDGDVTGPVVAVDINLGGDRANTSGCEPGDYNPADFAAPGTIALVQRGSCNFSVKVANAQQAGADAVIIFNQGNTPERSGVLTNVTAEAEGLVITVPVVGASFAAGEALAATGSTARVTAAFVTRISYNVIAELPGKNDANVVMAGAHLDSVPAGPGINDNGSGSAALLEIAQALGNHKPQNTLRFAWWGAEELGLLGSAAYVESLPQDELDRIALYMNFDMVGSPNAIYMVYDADQSTFPAPVAIPDGSIAIEDLFESYYTLVGAPYDDTEFSGRSDYEAFILAGIPSSGLFTGAEDIKTDAQEEIWGGTAGEQFDPCYHEACDTILNVSEAALDLNVDAIAFATLTYAHSTESVNGVPGAKVPGRFAIPAPAGPEGTFVEIE